MKTDPVISEIRRVRHQISAECGHDPKKYVEYLRKMEREFRPQIARFEALQRRNPTSPKKKTAAPAAK